MKHGLVTIKILSECLPVGDSDKKNLHNKSRAIFLYAMTGLANLVRPVNYYYKWLYLKKCLWLHLGSCGVETKPN